MILEDTLTCYVMMLCMMSNDIENDTAVTAKISLA